MSTRVLLADDHELFVDGIGTLLEKASGFQVIGQATDGEHSTESRAR